jgi:cation diffusion facilitator family transporter
MFTPKTRAAAVSILSNFTLISVKLVAGMVTGSVSLLAEAIHSLMDLAAAVIAFFSVRIADKPADEMHPFGHGKAENISGAVEGALIFIAAAIIIREAIKRLIGGASLEMLDIGIGIMAASIVINVLVSRYLLRVARKTDSLALEADAYHLTTDVITMAGVLAGLIIVRLTGLMILDPIVAIIVALLIVKAAFDITRKSFGGLMDRRLPEEEENIIKSTINEHSGQLVNFHGLLTRKSGSDRYIELHMVMPGDMSVQEAHEICDHLEQDIAQKLPQAKVTIHIEPCETTCKDCAQACTLRTESDSKSTSARAT